MAAMTTPAPPSGAWAPNYVLRVYVLEGKCPGGKCPGGK